MLKIIAVQVTELSNVGHDTELAAIFGAKMHFKKSLMEHFRFVSMTK